LAGGGVGLVWWGWGRGAFPSSTVFAYRDFSFSAPGLGSLTGKRGLASPEPRFPPISPAFYPNDFPRSPTFRILPRLHSPKAIYVRICRWNELQVRGRYWPSLPALAGEHRFVIDLSGFFPLSPFLSLFHPKFCPNWNTFFFFHPRAVIAVSLRGTWYRFLLTSRNLRSRLFSPGCVLTRLPWALSKVFSPFFSNWLA